MKKYILGSTLITLSYKLLAWQVVSLCIDELLVTAFIPETQDELYIASLNAIPYNFQNGEDTITAYVFGTYQASGYGYQGQISINEEDALAESNSYHSTQSNLNPNAQPFYPLSSIGLELFSLRTTVKHCFDYAFRKCYYSNCKYEHIEKSKLKNKVVCPKQIEGSCNRSDCIYYHLSDFQLTQAKNAEKRGKIIPLIICNISHVSGFEMSDCPYLHFSNPSLK